VTEILEIFWKNRILFLFLPIQGFLYLLPPPVSSFSTLCIKVLCIMKVVLKKYPLRSCLISKILYTKVMRVSL